jgi:hypothetical protein
MNYKSRIMRYYMEFNHGNLYISIKIIHNFFNAKKIIINIGASFDYDSIKTDKGVIMEYCHLQDKYDKINLIFCLTTGFHCTYNKINDI